VVARVGNYKGVVKEEKVSRTRKHHTSGLYDTNTRRKVHTISKSRRIHKKEKEE